MLPSCRIPAIGHGIIILSFIKELQRRNVFKVGTAYLVVAWLILQVLDVIGDILELPAWGGKLLLAMVAVGFPIALILAWAFELTPEGIKREHEVDREESITKLTGQKLNHLIIGLLLVAVIFLLVDDYVLDKSPPVADEQSRESPAVVADAEPPVKDVPVASNEKSIAVLPFVNMSPDPDQEYFSDGISEELLNLLAKVPDLKVIARTSSFAFKGQNVGIKDIAQTLGVEHVLEGSVRKAGNKVRITVQLIRAEDGSHLWSDTWDRELVDIFAIQDEIAGSVVEQLKVTLLGAAPRAQEVDPEAYSLFLQARHAYNQFTPDNFKQSAALFEQVLQRDPDYAAAWAWLAMARYQLVTVGNEYAGSARQAIDRSLELNPNSADAHAIAGQILMGDRQLEAAARHIQKALELEPSNFMALGWAVMLMRNLRRYDEAEGISQWVISRDPVNWGAHLHLSIAYFLSGQVDRALASFRNLLQLKPETFVAHTLVGLAMLQQGDLDEALAEVEAEPFEGMRLFGVAIAQHARGQTAESDAVLAGLIEKYGDTMPTHISAVLAVRGEADRAFTWLEKAARTNDPAMLRLPNPYAPMFDKLRDDPRWLPMLRSIGMAPEQLAAIKFDVTLPN